MKDNPKEVESSSSQIGDRSAISIGFFIEPGKILYERRFSDPS
jgi:hypothetical protein